MPQTVSRKGHPIFLSNFLLREIIDFKEKINWTRKLDQFLDCFLDYFLDYFLDFFFGRDFPAPENWTEKLDGKCGASRNWTEKLDGEWGAAENWTKKIGREYGPQKLDEKNWTEMWAVSGEGTGRLDGLSDTLQTT